MFSDTIRGLAETRYVSVRRLVSIPIQSEIHHQTVKANIRSHLYGVTAGVKSSSFFDPREGTTDTPRGALATSSSSTGEARLE
jgi:hypothetical protein